MCLGVVIGIFHGAEAAEEVRMEDCRGCRGTEEEETPEELLPEISRRISHFIDDTYVDASCLSFVALTNRM